MNVDTPESVVSDCAEKIGRLQSDEPEGSRRERNTHAPTCAPECATSSACPHATTPRLRAPARAARTQHTDLPERAQNSERAAARRPFASARCGSATGTLPDPGARAGLPSSRKHPLAHPARGRCGPPFRPRRGLIRWDLDEVAAGLDPAPYVLAGKSLLFGVVPPLPTPAPAADRWLCMALYRVRRSQTTRFTDKQ